MPAIQLLLLYGTVVILSAALVLTLDRLVGFGPLLGLDRHRPARTATEAPDDRESGGRPSGSPPSGAARPGPRDGVVATGVACRDCGRQNELEFRFCAHCLTILPQPLDL